MFLTPDDVQRLTGKKRFSAQRRVLDARKIRYTLGGKSGEEPLVRESDLDADGKPAHRRGHRWDRIASIRQLKAL